MNLFRRIARTSAAELHFRAAELAAGGVDAIRFHAGLERWRRDRLGARLQPLSPDLEAAQGALARGDWALAHISLRRHFLTRPSRFVMHPAQSAELTTRISDAFPGAASDAAARAAVLLDGRYPLLGYGPLSFRTGHGDPDWHFDPVHQRRAPVTFWSQVPYLDPRSGDHKVIWEINRHQYWLALGRAAWLTGNGACVTRFAEELDSWLRANPPLLGINWASMLELAFRSISWIWALHLFAALEVDSGYPWIVDLLVGLDRQLNHIARHLSFYFSPNTHLLGEGLALYVAGRSLPELAGSRRWGTLGRQILVRESRAQVNPDGGHAELSTHYHRYALDFYLLAVAVARRTDDPVAEVFAETASRLATCCRALADDSGWLPTIGDDDGGLLFPMCGRRPADASDSLALAAALLDRPDLAAGPAPEEVVWMTGRPGTITASTDPPASVLFPQTGYAVMRTPHAHAIVDVGPHGFLNGGHAHADALSIVLSIRGRRLLIDPGTATYVMNSQRRDLFRSQSMHNTLVLDGRPHSVPAGPFHWLSRADASLDRWQPSSTIDYLEGSHAAYAPLTHRRAVLRIDSDLWLIADHVLGRGVHRAETFWHFDPAWSLEEADSGIAAVADDGSRAGLVSTAPHRRSWRGDEGGFGWCAPVYGQLIPAPGVCFTREAEAPFSAVTAIAPVGRSDALKMEIVSATCGHEDGWYRAGAIVSRPDTQIVVLFTTSLAAPSHPLRPRAATRVALDDGVLVTDARAAVLIVPRGGGPRRLLTVEGSTAAWTGSDPFTVEIAGGVSDLHIDRITTPELSHSAEAPAVPGGTSRGTPFP